jgi:hypothetical protein
MDAWQIADAILGALWKPISAYIFLIMIRSGKMRTACNCFRG